METRICSRCHEAKALDTFVRCRRDPSGYASHCRDCQAQATRQWAERRRQGLTPNRQTARAMAHSGARRWGVEIECNGTTAASILAALRRHGIEVRDEGNNHTTRTYWKLTTDGSVSSRGTGHQHGGHELVSPPLSGEAGFAELQTVCTALAEAGAKADRTCGLHIHHEARELTAHTARNLIRQYTAARQTIDRLLAPSRRMGAGQANTYCREYKDRNIEAINNMHTIRDMANRVGRYRDVNLAAWGRQGTIEFRQHQGTVEYAKMEAWIKLTQAMLEKSLALTPDGAWGWDTVAGMVERLGQDVRYWTRREASLNRPAATVAA